MATQRRRRWNISKAITDYLDNLISLHPDWKATEVYEKLKEDHHNTDIPSLRTVQYYVQENRPVSAPSPWVPAHWPGPDAAQIITVLKFLRQANLLHWPTEQEARKLHWLLTGWPDLPLEIAWRLAGLYTRYEIRSLSTERFDIYLSFAPWRSAEDEQLYLELVPEAQRTIYPRETGGTFKIEVTDIAGGTIAKEPAEAKEAVQV
jgi:hypothetical protein